jgi:hypothetical protein
VEPTLDNRMILGGMGNLRLAPHVREGRGVVPARGVGAAPRTSAAPDGSAASAGTGERVSISPEARAAFEQALGRASGAEARSGSSEVVRAPESPPWSAGGIGPPTPAPGEASEAAPTTATGDRARVASAIAAYAESAEPLHAPTPSGPAPDGDGRQLLAGGLYA